MGAVKQDAKPTLRQWLKSADPDHRHIERLVLLTDGVYAIALTLLALEIRLPDRWNGPWQGLFESLALPLSAYFFAFFVLAVSWAQHRQMFAFLRGMDGTATALHFATLAFVALTPAAINILIAHFNFPGIAVYAACTILLKLSEAAFWAYVGLFRDYVDPHLTRVYRVWTLVANLAILVGAAAIVVGAAPPPGGKMGVATIPIWSWTVLAGGAAIRMFANRRIRARAIPRS